MFGVMQYKACAQSDQQRDEHRLHYCGTCKTMGALYGQASRMLLNNDAVFLAELLTAFARRAEVSGSNLPGWAIEYQSYNCMALPSKSADLPLPLQLAADVTMLLTELKINDHVEDSRSPAWPVAQRVFSKTARQASQSLAKKGFPMADILTLFSEQSTRERFVTVHSSSMSLLQSIDYCAKPTADITAAVFASAARVMNCSGAAQASLGEIGAAFGSLVYLLDAVEDYPRDARRRQFNPFILFLTTEPDKAALPATLLELVLPYARAQVGKIEAALRRHLDREVSDSFSKRLHDNISGKLGPAWSPCVSRHHQARAQAKVKPVCSNTPLNWSERKKLSCEVANNFLTYTPGTAILYCAVWLTVFLFPYYSKQSKTVSQCLSIPMNLIAWGNLINDVSALTKVFRPVLTPGFAAMGAASAGGSINSSGGSRGGDGDDGGDGSGDGDGGDPQRTKRSRRPFGEPGRREPSPDLVPGPNEDQPSQSPSQSPAIRNQRTDSRTRYSNSPYASDPRYANTSGCYCCAECCENIGCNICVNCACNSCCDAGCSGADCCASSGGGAECCGADCCGGCGGSGGADCCSLDCCNGCGGGADCCGSADCCSADCCTGCNGCN